MYCRASCCAGATFVRGPDTLCDPNKQPSVCIYTSSGTERAAVPDCQIERCCPTCTSDEDANNQGYGAVCAGSTAGLKRKKKKPPAICCVLCESALSAIPAGLAWPPAICVSSYEPMYRIYLASQPAHTGHPPVQVLPVPWTLRSGFRAFTLPLTLSSTRTERTSRKQWPRLLVPNLLPD